MKGKTMYNRIQKSSNSLRLICQQKIRVIREANALGYKNNQQTFVEIEQIQTKLVNNQLEIIEAAIVANGRVDMELHKILQPLKDELQKELLEIQKQGFRNRLSNLEQNLEERVAVLKAYVATTQITQQDFWNQEYEIYHENSLSQLALVREYISVAKDLDFLDSLRRKEADILAKGV